MQANKQFTARWKDDDRRKAFNIALAQADLSAQDWFDEQVERYLDRPEAATKATVRPAKEQPTGPEHEQPEIDDVCISRPDAPRRLGEDRGPLPKPGKG